MIPHIRTVIVLIIVGTTVMMGHAAVKATNATVHKASLSWNQ